VRRFATAIFVLLAITGTGCLMTRPCAPGNWHYHTCDHCCTMCGQRPVSRQSMPGEQSLARQAVASRMPASSLAKGDITAPDRPAIERKSSSPAVTACDWDDSGDRSPSAKMRASDQQALPSAKPKPKEPHAAEASSAVASIRRESPPAKLRQADPTPYNWGFFGSSAKW
jgi:hypothetical protein